MTLIRKRDSILNRLKRDESGTMAIAWALSMAIMLGAMGAAVDIAFLSAAKNRAQSITDTTALAAAIYVRDNEIVPENREDGLIGLYSADELGYDFRDWVIDGASGVNINVTYDLINREAVVRTTGKTRPWLMQVFGHNELNFDAETVVKFLERDVQDPASIVLVLDNSGSMFFDDNPLDSDGNRPAGTQRRIDGLTSSANNFMDYLDETVGIQDGVDETRTLRTGMMAFAGDIISARTVPMQWGTISETAINSMVPRGRTNSAPPLRDADRWLNINEPPIHEAENPGKTPLKYIVLMTDGRNTVGTEEWVARAGTENYRRFVTGRPSPEGLTGEGPGDDPTPSRELVSRGKCSNTGTYQAKCYRNGKLRSTEGIFSSHPGNYESTFTNGRGRVRPVFCRGEEIRACTANEFRTTWSGYEYHVGETPPDGGAGWEEGEFDITSNIETREHCDSLHADGVEIYSIAYALSPGLYRVNDFRSNPDDTRETTVENSNRARAILQYCASKSENFITADNADALESAFDRIGNTIVNEIIRIDS